MTKAQTLRIFAILATALLIAGSAFAAGPVDQGGSLAWNQKAGAGIQLQISGPGGFSHSATFEAGEMPTFSLFGDDGGLLSSGQYNWQITVMTASKVRGEDAPGARGESFSGTFRLDDGNVILPKARVGAGDSDSITKDQVIVDDLIVDGSACIGMDCVNGENFGFDTLRMKENNVRIKFDDTSNSGSFPFNDWQLTANDSSNGGANKFSIDDVTNGRTPFTIEATAPSNSLYVDDGGRIGVGTSAPVVELQVVDGDSPTLRLEQNGSSGFTAQTWDLAGNETNFFVRDVTNSSKLPFRIKPTAPTDSLFIAANGDIGLGTDSPSQALHLLTTTADNISVRIQNSQSNGWDLRTNTSGQLAFTLSGSGSNELVIDDADGSVTIDQLSGGDGSDYICVDANGKLFRSNTAC